MAKNITAKTQKEYQLTAEQFKDMQAKGLLRGACLSETMGPMWKHIYWSPAKRPYVLKES